MCGASSLLTLSLFSFELFRFAAFLRAAPQITERLVKAITSIALNIGINSYAGSF